MLQCVCGVSVVCACVYSDRWMTSCLMADVNNLYLFLCGWYTSETGSPSAFLPLGYLFSPDTTPQLAVMTLVVFCVCVCVCVCVCCRVTVGCNSSHWLFATCMQVHPNRCLVFQNADVIKVCPHLIWPLNIYYSNMHLWHLCLFLSLQCSSDYAPVCGSNGESYENHCLLRKDACKLQTEVLVVSEGTCPVGTSLCHRGDSFLCVCVPLNVSMAPGKLKL